MFTKLADFVVYNLAGLDKETHMAESLHFFVEDSVKIFVMLALMMIIVSFFRSQLDSERVKEYLEGKPRWMAYFLAVILGAVTPFCSCSSIPLFIGFVEAGIPFGVTMAFLITSPMINEVAIIIFASVVGVKLAVVYVITGMAVGLVGGILMDVFGLEKYTEKFTQKKQCCCCSSGSKKETLEEKQITGFKARAIYAFEYTYEMVSQIWIYILLGIGVGALIHGYVPQEFFIKYTSADNVFAVPLAVIFGIPLYSNATGVIPIAEALLGKGVPIGTVLVMMMSVVAISLPEMIILRRAMKVRLLFYFGLYIFLSLIAVGYLYNFVF